MKLMIFISFFIFLLLSSACSSHSVSTYATHNPYKGKKVSAYLIGKYENIYNVRKKLQRAGFQIIAEYEPVARGTTLVFTNTALKHQASRPGRAEAAVLRVFIDEKNKIISFTNPIYFGKAFMQDQFHYDVYAKVRASIEKEFVNLHGSEDKLKFEDLAHFHFMVGMPYFQDKNLLGEGSTNEELLKKLQTYKKGKYFVFQLKLSKTSILVGYELSKRTKKFVKKIGRMNAAILPWTIGIEDGKAKTLNAKYYIALSYPSLTMNDFMGIATVPGTIIKELSKPFRK